MPTVKIGDITIGRIIEIGSEVQAFRVGADGDVPIGQTTDRTKALNLIARSLIASAVNPRSMSPDVRMKLAEALEMIRVAGLGNVADYIEKALR